MQNSHVLTINDFLARKPPSSTLVTRNLLLSSSELHTQPTNEKLFPIRSMCEIADTHFIDTQRKPLFVECMIAWNLS